MKLLLESFVKEKVHLDVNTCEKVPTSFKEDNEVVRCLNKLEDAARGLGELRYQMCNVVFLFLVYVVFVLLCA